MVDRPRSGDAPPHEAFPGDELLTDANLVFDRRRRIAATPEEIWPWLVQLGKRRARWYLPASVERFVPPARRGSREIESRWLDLAVGERIPDYGGGDAWLEAVSIDPPRALVYFSERRGTTATWALLPEADGPGSTIVHLRFRARLQSTGLLRRVITVGGDGLDRITALPMLAGLEERVTAPASRRSG